MLVWEKDLSNLARIIIKVRVIDVELVPKSIQITDGDGFLSESWTILCEIISQSILGASPPEEDDPPADGGDPHPFPPQPWHQPPPKPGIDDPLDEEADPQRPDGPAEGNQDPEFGQQGQLQLQLGELWNAWPLVVLEAPNQSDEDMWEEPALNPGLVQKARLQPSHSSTALSEHAPSWASSSLSVTGREHLQLLPLASVLDLNLPVPDQGLEVQHAADPAPADQPGQVNLELQLGMVLVPHLGGQVERENQSPNHVNGPFSPVGL